MNRLPKPPILRLPAEIVQAIFEMVELVDLGRLPQVCRAFSHSIKDNLVLCKVAYRKRFVGTSWLKIRGAELMSTRTSLLKPRIENILS